MAQSLEAKIVVLGSQGVGKTSLVSLRPLFLFVSWDIWPAEGVADLYVWVLV